MRVKFLAVRPENVGTDAYLTTLAHSSLLIYYLADERSLAVIHRMVRAQHSGQPF